MIGRLVGTMVGVGVGLAVMPYVNNALSARVGIVAAPGFGLDDVVNSVGIGLTAFAGQWAGHKVAGMVFKAK